MNVDQITFYFDSGAQVHVRVITGPRAGLRVSYEDRHGVQSIEIPDVAGFNALRDALNFIAERNRPDAAR